MNSGFESFIGMDNFQCITVSTIKFDHIKHLQIGKSNPKVSYILNQLVNSSLSENSISVFQNSVAGIPDLDLRYKIVGSQIGLSLLPKF